jgi:hypothetical protein
MVSLFFCWLPIRRLRSDIAQIAQLSLRVSIPVSPAAHSQAAINIAQITRLTLRLFHSPVAGCRSPGAITCATIDLNESVMSLFAPLSPVPYHRVAIIHKANAVSHPLPFARLQSCERQGCDPYACVHLQAPAVQCWTVTICNTCNITTLRHVKSHHGLVLPQRHTALRTWFTITERHSGTEGTAYHGRSHHHRSWNRPPSHHLACLGR